MVVNNISLKERFLLEGMQKRGGKVVKPASSNTPRTFPPRTRETRLPISPHADQHTSLTAWEISPDCITFPPPSV